jgi:hypothetical protein
MTAGPFLMTAFLDFLFIYPHVYYDYMLYESAKITEATAVKILQSLQTKEMRIISVITDGPSSQMAGLSDEDGLECLRNLPSAAVECSADSPCLLRL